MGDPNISAFYERYSPVLKGTDLRLGKTSFSNMARGTGSSPYGASLEALAAILSAAKGDRITVATLDSLIERPSLESFETELDESELPDEKAIQEELAAELLESLRALSLDVRSTIAPKILHILADDWAYLDSPDHIQISQLLSDELDRRGMGLKAYADGPLGGEIPIEILEDIRSGRFPRQPLNKSQILALRKNLRSVDGDTLDLSELDCLMHIDP
jgi:hypothetical protein